MGCGPPPVRKTLDPEKISLHQWIQEDRQNEIKRLTHLLEQGFLHDKTTLQNMHFQLAYLYFQVKNFEQSQKYFSALMKEENFAYPEYVYFYLGRIVLEQNDCDQAKIFHATLKKKFANSPSEFRFQEAMDTTCKPPLDIKTYPKKERREILRRSFYETALDAYKNKNYDEAVTSFEKYLNHVHATHPHVKDTLLKLAIIYKRQGQKEKHLKMLWRLAKLEPASRKFPYHPKWLYEIAKFYWNNDEVGKTKTYLQKLIQWPEHNYVGRSHYILAKLSAEQFQYLHASAQMDQASQNMLSASLEEEIIYLKGWYAYRGKEFASATLEFKKFLSQYPKSDYAATVRYWLGRSYEKMDNPREAQEIFKDTLKSSPHSYYAFRALNRLKSKRESTSFEKKLSFSFPSSVLEKLDVPQFNRIEELVRLGFGEDATYELQKMIPLDQTFRWPWRFQYYLAGLYHLSGDYISSFVILNSLQQRHGNDLPNHYWLLLYPRRYWKLIVAYAKQFEIDPYLILSIMRQESAFDPYAISSADAYGLLQIQPMLAEALGHELKRPLKDKNELLIPEVNLYYCMYYISKLLKQYNGNMVLTLAAYNSNPAAVQKWMHRYWSDDVEEFIEQIPYRETRSYVKLISRNYSNNYLIHEKQFKLFP